MKAIMKDGTTIECTPQEYIELVKLGLVGGNVAPQKEITRVAEPTPVEQPQAPMPKEPTKTLEPVEKRGWHKWSEQETAYIITNSKKPMEQLARDLGNKYTAKAVHSRLYMLAGKGLVLRENIGSCDYKYDKYDGESTNKKWDTATEERVIHMLKGGLNFKEIAKKIPGRSYKAIKQHVYELVKQGTVSRDVLPRSTKVVPPEPTPKKVVIVQEAKTKKNNVSDAHREYLTKRMKFVTSRARELCKQFGWKYEKALSKASEEWNDAQVKFAKEKVAKKDEIELDDLVFPTFNTISDMHQHFIEQMIRNMIATNGKIGFRDMFSIMTNEQSTKWTGYTWRNFLVEFMSKSAAIAKCFNVENKFNIRKDDNGYEVMHYGTKR